MIPRAQIIKTIAPIIKGWADAILPPPAPMDIIEYSRSIIIPENKEGDRSYDPEANRATYFILRAIMRGYRKLVFIGPAQDGKTLLLVIILSWVLFERRRGCGLAYPDMRINDDQWGKKYLPVIRAMGHDKHFPDEGSGSDSGTAPTLLLKNTAALFRLGAGAQNQAGQAGRTVYCVIKDEHDDMRPQKASKLDQRTQGQEDDYLIITTSTIKRSDSPTHRQYSNSTMCRIGIPCFHCGVYFVPDWFDHVRYDNSSARAARETVRLICPEGCEMDDDERKAVCRRGVEVAEGQTLQPDGSVEGPEPQALEYGMLWESLTSERKSLRRMAEEYVDAEVAQKRGNIEPMQTWHQDTLSRHYSDPGKSLQADKAILARKSALAQHDLGQVPDENTAPIIVTCIDVQHRELYYASLALSADLERWWIVDHGYYPFAGSREIPTEQQFTSALDEVEKIVLRGYERPSGEIVFPVVGGVDVKDGTNPHREALHKWIAAHPGWHAVHGQGAKQSADDRDGAVSMQIPGVLTVADNAKLTGGVRQLIAINVFLMRQRLVRELMADMNAARCGYLPRDEGSDGHLIKELTAEKLEETKKGPAWVRIYRHNHRFDLGVYCLALAEWWVATVTQNTAASAADYVQEAAK